MKTFSISAAQGEITIIRIGDAGVNNSLAGEPLKIKQGKIIIGHSETGHDHVLEHSRGVSGVECKDAPDGMRVLRAILTEPNKLVHNRTFDTHESLALQPGMYEIRIGREYDPYAEIARQQAD